MENQAFKPFQSLIFLNFCLEIENVSVIYNKFAEERVKHA